MTSPRGDGLEKGARTQLATCPRLQTRKRLRIFRRKVRRKNAKVLRGNFLSSIFHSVFSHLFRFIFVAPFRHFAFISFAEWHSEQSDVPNQKSTQTNHIREVENIHSLFYRSFLFSLLVFPRSAAKRLTFLNWIKPAAHFRAEQRQEMKKTC